ncbi:2019_t:CDS:2 [Funneliformis caledonium]|uniref:2019_t:CDS:1 n=1 Tax=Funneliformis caledonium TaxID=1117310 RepID=A0A9N9DGY9_9GLOM|nr:2019_t:CDS:2 [Funneliformis caledonium]
MVAKKSKNTEFNIYSNRSSPEIEFINNNIATGSNTKPKKAPISITQDDDFFNILNSSDKEFETDNESIFSDNNVDFDETISNYETIEDSNSDKNISKYNELEDQNSPNKKSNEDYLYTNYNPIDIDHNPLIFNSNEVTKWELLHSFNDVTFADFPSTLYRGDRLIGIENCECNELITKMIRTSKGKYLVKPIKVYPYHSIIRQLGVFLSKPGMEDLIESCFDRDIEDDIFADIYEGRVWKEFTENTFVIGIIPGPHEPDVNEIHQYIKPLVDEFLQLWTGQVIKTPNYPFGRIYRVALIMISCDTPIRGFSSHSSKRGCYRCDHTFPMIQNRNTSKWKPDFGNFNFNLPQRSREKHLNIAYEYKNASSSISNQIFSEHDIGRIPLKIASRFAGFTADQWKS